MRASAEPLRLLRAGVSVAEANRAWQRSNLSSRGRVLREADRRGKWFGIISRARPGGPLDMDEATLLAAQSAKGIDGYDHCAVPARWHPIFVRRFVASAFWAAHTLRSFTVRSA